MKLAIFLISLFAASGLGVYLTWLLYDTGYTIPAVGLGFITLWSTSSYIYSAAQIMILIKELKNEIK